MQWLQAHARDVSAVYCPLMPTHTDSTLQFKAAIQARYMDWVVHGYKFNVISPSSHAEQLLTNSLARLNLILELLTSRQV